VVIVIQSEGSGAFVQVLHLMNFGFPMNQKERIFSGFAHLINAMLVFCLLWVVFTEKQSVVAWIASACDYAMATKTLQ
jgi:phosphatidylserine synthase